MVENEQNMKCRFYSTCTLSKMPYWCEDFWKASACEEYQRRLDELIAEETKKQKTDQEA